MSERLNPAEALLISGIGQCHQYQFEGRRQLLCQAQIMVAILTTGATVLPACSVDRGAWAPEWMAAGP